VIKGELGRQEYLASYGHRSAHEFEMSIPYSVEDPDYLDRQIADYQKSGVDVETLLANQQAQFSQAKERFIRRYPGKRKWLENNLGQIERAAQACESLRSEFTRTFRVMRAFMLKAGELTGIGKDVFFLYIFEIPQVLKGSRDVLSHLPARKHNYERYCSLPTLPLFIKGRFDPFEWVNDPARRVDYYDPDAKPALADADPAKIKGFAGAAGIVARELGIPAVVGCGTATSRLSTASLTSAGTTDPILYKSAIVSISAGLCSRPKPPSKSDPMPTVRQPATSAMWRACFTTCCLRVTGMDLSFCQPGSRNRL
jgi:hypothetical protein